MKLSELLTRLFEIKTQYGDLDCVDSYDEAIGDPEVIDGVLVLCDKS